MGAESDVFGEWIRELCTHGAEVFTAGGVGAEWVEDACDVWHCRRRDSGELPGVFGYGNEVDVGGVVGVGMFLVYCELFYLIYPGLQNIIVSFCLLSMPWEKIA